MNPLFDIRGNIYPAILTEMSMHEVENHFVSSFDLSSSRYLLFEEYKRYTQNLSNVVGCPFYQWINGSFASNSRMPDDIDLVSFIDYETYQSKEVIIDDQFSRWSVQKHYTDIDAYTVWAYPSNHPYSLTFQADYIYWHDWFAHTRYNRRRERFTKGFIQVTID